MQDNQEKVLRETIKQMNQIPDKVNQKIEKTLSNLEEKEGKEMKKRRKLIPIAATVLIALFLGGNGIAYATGKPNIFSYVLSKFNISEEYAQEAKEIGMTQNSNGIEITVTDLALDKNMLIVGYKIKGKQITKTPFFLEGVKTVQPENGKEININYLSTGERRNKQQIQEIKQGEYQVYEIYTLNETAKNMELKIELNKIQYYTPNEYNVEYQEELSGKWNFKIPITSKEIETKEYQPKNAKIELSSKENITINSIRINQIATMVDITANTEKIVTMQVKNKAGEILLKKDTQEIGNGQNLVIMKKIKEEEELLVELYGYGTENKLAEKTIVWKNEEKITKEPVTEKQTQTLGNMKIEFPKKWEVNKEQANTIILNIYQEYQNKQKEFDSYVKIEKIENMEDKTLEKIKKQEIRKEEIGYAIREENYFSYDTSRKKYAIIDEKDYSNEKGNKFMITKQEIDAILKGEKEAITKNQIKVTKQELEDILQPGFQVQEEKKTTIAGKEAFELTIRTNGGTQGIVLIKDAKRYYKITYRLDSKSKQQIEDMIQKIKFD